MPTMHSARCRSSRPFRETVHDHVKHGIDDRAILFGLFYHKRLGMWLAIFAGAVLVFFVVRNCILLPQKNVTFSLRFISKLWGILGKALKNRVIHFKRPRSVHDKKLDKNR
jgi:hypothetical protein